MTRTEYQQMSTGYSLLRLATPSGTGQKTQPCANCGKLVRFSRSRQVWVHWGHDYVDHRGCAS